MLLPRQYTPLVAAIAGYFIAKHSHGVSQICLCVYVPVFPFILPEEGRGVSFHGYCLILMRHSLFLENLQKLYVVLWVSLRLIIKIEHDEREGGRLVCSGVERVYLLNCILVIQLSLEFLVEVVAAFAALLATAEAAAGTATAAAGAVAVIFLGDRAASEAPAASSQLPSTTLFFICLYVLCSCGPKADFASF